jgi:pyruvate/2-oxoglutarate dehydrogenase complex dihydrolipoamide acyltransferase (E2) component
MATKIIMPQLGESVVDGTVGEWLKQIGDTVEEYESIVRVSTDKVDTEIPSPASGILLAIHVPEGETVNAGVLLGIVGQAGENPDRALTPTGGKRPAPEPAPERQDDYATPVYRNGYVGHVTPVVARMAAEHDLNLSEITGSGRDGRITKKDVLAYLEQRQSKPPTQVDMPPWERPGSGDLFKPTVEYNYSDEPPTITKPKTDYSAKKGTPAKRPPLIDMSKRDIPLPAEPVRLSEEQGTLQSVPGDLLPLSNIRRSIAKHMVESALHIAPHVTTVFEIDLSAIIAHRESMREMFERQGVKLTFTPYFVTATATVLHDHPRVNSRWTEEGIYAFHVAHIGMAVAIEDGLIVPVIKNAGDYTLIGLSRQVNDLAERARNKQLKPDEVRDGTFTITNHGVSGSLFATPIINQPQSAILGIGAIEKRVKVINDSIAIRPCAYFSLTFDHRVLDGATADAFMVDLKQKLETWQ